MKVKSAKKLSFLNQLLPLLKKIPSKITFIVMFYLLSLSAIGLGGIYYGTKLPTSENSAIFASFYRYFRPSLNIVEHFFRGVFSNSEIINIHVDYIDYKKLSFLVEKSKEKNRILPEFKEEDVDGIIENNNILYDVSLKIRGTYLEHVRGDKWSLRIRMKDDRTLFGMQRFSISSPETRSHIHEWLFQRALSSEGLINLRYQFIQVNLNGKNLGIYALEEFFDKRLIENNKLREGIIVKPLLTNDNGDIFVYQKNKTFLNESLKLSYTNLSDLLESLKLGYIPASSVFDIEKSAKYFALTSLFGGQHGHISINFVCYFNPVTNLLEPIGYDSDVSRKIERYGGMITSKTNAYHDAIFNNNSILSDLFKSEDFYKSYINHLNRIIDKNYIDTLLVENESELKNNLNILYKEYYYFDYFERDYFTDNRNYIINNLRTNLNVQASLLSYNEGDQINLSLDNLKDVRIEIIDATIRGNLFSPNEKILINSTKLMDKEYFTLYKTQLNDKIVKKTSSKNILRFKIFGLDTVHSIKIDDSELFLLSNREINYIKEKRGNVELFEFIDIDNDNKEIKIKSGNYQLSQDLIVPPNYKFIIEDGTRIDLINNANIISYSPIYFKGTQSNPIDIFSSDFSGQGITVINAKDKSLLENVNIDGLNYPNKNGIYQMGSVNFYQSPVDIIRFKISNNHSEDALNIIRSNYTISHSKFSNIFSDAFDGDFSDGTILNTEFINCGNDAIDISGSIVNLDSVYIENAGDKGLSVGENSNLKGRNIHIQKSEIGIASKDFSLIDLDNVFISDTKIGFAAYQKKSEYGPAKIIVTNYRKNNIEREYLIENKSSMIVDNNKIESVNTKVENLLYGNIYGKKSK